MNVTCDKCNKRYAIADDKVRGKSVKIRCKQCQNLISVQGPPVSGVAPAAVIPAGLAAAAASPSPWDDERTRAMPPMDLSPTWFAMVKGKQIGPLSIRDLDAKVKSTEVTLRTYLWKQGMADWKRASDVPEVSPIFAGVSVGAAAVGPTQAAPEARPAPKAARAPARDVATANEMPSPEVTRKNGNGHGAPEPLAREPQKELTQPFAPTTKAPAKSDQVEAPKPEPKAAKPSSKGRGPFAQTQPIPEAEPEPAPQSEQAPLNDLFSDVSGLNAKPAAGELGPEGGTDPGTSDAERNADPFAALGEANPDEAPPPGEATKFFIAQAGVNKRNPPWKIALFVVAIIGVPVGVLALLSTLHVVPPVLVTNDKGEMVEQSFFTPEGFSVGIKDLLSGDAKKKQAEAARRKAEAAEAAAARKARDRGPQAPGEVVAGLDKRRDTGPEGRKFTKEELEKLYGSGGPSGSDVTLGAKADVGPKVRIESSQPTVEKGGGLDSSAVAKTMSDRMKALVGCVEDALKRNPNVKLEKVKLVIEVATSGAVSAASLEPKRVELTDWGGCIRDRAKKIIFPQAESESQIEIPLVLGASMQ